MQDMNLNAVMIGPEFQTFRALLWRFFIEDQFKGKCWLVTDDQLYKSDLDKIKGVAGDRLILGE
jgi:hypothetical protein